MMSLPRASACTENAGPGLADALLSQLRTRFAGKATGGDVHGATGLQPVPRPCSPRFVQGRWATACTRRVACSFVRAAGLTPILGRAGSSRRAGEESPLLPKGLCVLSGPEFVLPQEQACPSLSILGWSSTTGTWVDSCRSSSRLGWTRSRSAGSRCAPFQRLSCGFLQFPRRRPAVSSHGT